MKGEYYSDRKIAEKNPLVGLSDHTQDILSSLFALGIGVEAAEKHFY